MKRKIVLLDTILSACTHTRAYAHALTHTHTYTYTYTHARAHAPTRTHARTHTNTHTHTHTHTHSHSHTHTHTHSTHTHTHTYTHTHTHTHKHTQSLPTTHTSLPILPPTANTPDHEGSVLIPRSTVSISTEVISLLRINRRGTQDINPLYKLHVGHQVLRTTKLDLFVDRTNSFPFQMIGATLRQAGKPPIPLTAHRRIFPVISLNTPNRPEEICGRQKTHPL